MQELLARAYNQDHYTLAEVETFLAEIEPSIGAGDLLALHKLMINKYGMPRRGTTRVTYISKVVGFKVPIAAFQLPTTWPEQHILDYFYQ